MANRTKLTPEKRQQFLDVLSETANVSRAAEAIGVSRRHMYDVRDEDEAFKSEWNKAVDRGCAALEDEATRRAVEGWDEPVFYQGQQTGLVRKFSDTLLMFRLKAQWPEKYRENSTVTHAGQQGIDVRISFVDPAPRVTSHEGEDNAGDGGSRSAGTRAPS